MGGNAQTAQNRKHIQVTRHPLPAVTLFLRICAVFSTFHALRVLRVLRTPLLFFFFLSRKINPENPDKPGGRLAYLKQTRNYMHTQAIHAMVCSGSWSDDPVLVIIN